MWGGGDFLNLLLYIVHICSPTFNCWLENVGCLCREKFLFFVFLSLKLFIVFRWYWIFSIRPKKVLQFRTKMMSPLPRRRSTRTLPCSAPPTGNICTRFLNVNNEHDVIKLTLSLLCYLSYIYLLAFRTYFRAFLRLAPKRPALPLACWTWSRRIIMLRSL